jgi:phosphomannomutase
VKLQQPGLYASAVSISSGLLAQVNSWLAQDPDPVTRDQLTKLVIDASTDLNALKELEDAFFAALEFGTAGLRGPLGPGPNRMNRVTVLQAAAGLAKYLMANGEVGQPIVIGFDARYNSDVFANDTAQVMAGAGLKPIIFSHVVPTPVLAFSISQLGACAAVMVTASHNPAQDNGYKVYLGDGRQIVSPVDTEISNHIRSVVDVREVKLSNEIETLSENITKSYIEAITHLITGGPTTTAQRSEIKSVYTAMHGVGWQTLKQTFFAAGLAEPIAVDEQRDPDPTFPTVAFPNPEEKGALDLAVALAIKSSADVLIANDPDADRLAIALPTIDKNWLALRGDQIGCLLAWWIIERNSDQKIKGTFANSIVSSMLLEQIAKRADINYEVTLTGFKWVSRVPNLSFGYEEALGYCVDPQNVKDKDGISAAAMFVEMMAFLAQSNRTPWDILDELALNHGHHATDQVVVRVTETAQVGVVMSGLRNSPPKLLGGMSVSRIDDLDLGFGNLPATDAIVIHLSGNSEVENARAIIRPSGTEPKIKCYLEVVVRNNDLLIARQISEKALQALVKDAAPLLNGGN